MKMQKENEMKRNAENTMNQGWFGGDVSSNELMCGKVTRRGGRRLKLDTDLAYLAQSKSFSAHVLPGFTLKQFH